MYFQLSPSLPRFRVPMCQRRHYSLGTARDVGSKSHEILLLLSVTTPSCVFVELGGATYGRPQAFQLGFTDPKGAAIGRVGVRQSAPGRQGSRGMCVGKEYGIDDGVTRIVALRQVLCNVSRRNGPKGERDVQRNVVGEKNVVEIACSIYSLRECSLFRCTGTPVGSTVGIISIASLANNVCLSAYRSSRSIDPDGQGVKSDKKEGKSANAGVVCAFVLLPSSPHRATAWCR